MAEAIGATGGSSAYGVGGFPTSNKGKKENVEEKQEQQVKQPETKNVDADEVFAFLASNNYYVPAAKDANNDGVIDKIDFDVDPEMQARIDQFMADFDVVYKLIEDEFGAELAPRLVDMVMDRVMGY